MTNLVKEVTVLLQNLVAVSRQLVHVRLPLRAVW